MFVVVVMVVTLCNVAMLVCGGDVVLWCCGVVTDL